MASSYHGQQVLSAGGAVSTRRSSPLEVVVNLREVAELLGVEREDRRRASRPDVHLVRLLLADPQAAELLAIGLVERHLEDGGVKAVFGRIVSLRRHDLFPAEGAEIVEEVGDLVLPGLARLRLGHAPLGLALLRPRPPPPRATPCPPLLTRIRFTSRGSKNPKSARSRRSFADLERSPTYWASTSITGPCPTIPA